MHIRNLDRSSTNFEYGIHSQRNFPWEGVVTPPFGNLWGIVAPGTQSEANSHHEAEAFFIVKGEGRIRVGAEESEVKAGDLIYVPPFEEHTLENTGSEELVMLAFWWETTEAQEQTEAQ